MAKRKEEQANTTTDIEQRMLALAEQLGRIAGTVQAKAEGWLDRDALKTQISSIRDGATDLLDQIAASRPVAAITRGAQAQAAATNRPGASARSAKSAPAKPATPPAPKRAARAKKPTKMGAASTSGRAGSRKTAAKGRSGGAVDAPGKKHRGPMPSESAATGTPRGEGSRLAKLKAANLNRMQRRG